jgi:hypothetical protein
MAVYGLDSPFIFLAGETTQPFPWAQYLASDDFISAGYEEISNSLESLLTARKTNVWKAYDTSLKTLNRPYWAKGSK